MSTETDGEEGFFMLHQERDAYFDLAVDGSVIAWPLGLRSTIKGCAFLCNIVMVLLLGRIDLDGSTLHIIHCTKNDEHGTNGVTSSGVHHSRRGGEKKQLEECRCGGQDTLAAGGTYRLVRLAFNCQTTNAREAI